MVDTTSNIELAGQILSAYVSNNAVRPSELPGLFGEIHGALVHLANGTAPVVAPEPQMPAVSPKKSITNDFLICLEDGRRFKSHAETPFAHRLRLVT